MSSKILKFLFEFQKLNMLFMLGAGMILTAFAMWYTYILAYLPWAPELKAEIIHSLSLALFIILGLNGTVIIALTFGKVNTLKVGNGAFSGEVTFDDDDNQESKDGPKASFAGEITLPDQKTDTSTKDVSDESGKDK